MIEHGYWYLVRGAGFAAYITLSLSMIWGLMLANRLGENLLGKPAMFEAHRVISLFLLLVSAVHVAPLLADNFIEWDAKSLLVPFQSDYRPAWTGAGVLALYLSVVLAFSFRVRKRIGYRAWRWLHFASFAAYAGATAHGIRAGTDSGEPWAIAVYASSLATVVFLVNLRILGGARDAPVPASRVPPTRPTERAPAA